MGSSLNTYIMLVPQTNGYSFGVCGPVVCAGRYRWYNSEIPEDLGLSLRLRPVCFTADFYDRPSVELALGPKLGTANAVAPLVNWLSEHCSVVNLVTFNSMTKCVTVFEPMLLSSQVIDGQPRRLSILSWFEAVSLTGPALSDFPFSLYKEGASYTCIQRKISRGSDLIEKLKQLTTSMSSTSHRVKRLTALMKETLVTRFSENC